MLKRILPLLLLLTPWAWGQYSTTTQSIAQDITSYCTSTTNCFVPLAAQDCSHGIRVGGDGFIGCLDSTGKLMTYNTSSKAWGNGWTGQNGFAIQNSTTIYVLRPSGYCTSPNYGVYSLNTSDGSYLFENGCATGLNVSGDGTLVLTNSVGDAYYTLNPANGWTQLPLGVWGWIAAANASLVVAAKSSDHTVWQCNPSNCTWSQLGTLSNAVDVTAGGSGDVSVMGSDYKLHHWNGSSWGAAYGKSISGIAEASKGMILATVGGQPYHWNIIAGGVSTTLSGTGPTSCGGACPPNTVHTGNVQVHIANGLNGQDEVGTADAHHNINVASSDFAPGCDFFLGSEPSDPTCTPTFTSGVHCPILGRDTYDNNGGGISPPCFIPRGSHAIFGSGTINVYFDNTVFSGAAPGAYWWFVYQGIASTSVLNGRSFNSMGLASPSCTTHFNNLGDGYTVNVPCGAVEPYIFVTSDANIPWDTLGSNDTNGHNYIQPNGPAFISFPWTILTLGSDSEYQHTGAHEMGHLSGLGDCCDPSLDANGCTDPSVQGETKQCKVSSISDTIMWWELVSGQNATTPSLCDITWASVYNGFTR